MSSRVSTCLGSLSVAGSRSLCDELLDELALGLRIRQLLAEDARRRLDRDVGEPRAQLGEGALALARGIRPRLLHDLPRLVLRLRGPIAPHALGRLGGLPHDAIGFLAGSGQLALVLFATLLGLQARLLGPLELAADGLLTLFE